MQRNEHTEEYKKKTVEEWLNSSETTSKAVFSKSKGISPRTLGRWCDKYLEDLSTHSPSGAPEPLYEELYEEITYIGSSKSITLYKGSEQATVHADSPHFSTVLDYIQADELPLAWENANRKRAIEKWKINSISVEDGVVSVAGFPVNNMMTDKLLTMIEVGDDGAERFALFFESLMEVSDKRVVDELYNFLKYNDIQLNKNGTFTGYKAVRHDYLDKYTESINNVPGVRVKVPRAIVDDDCTATCSQGLHVGSLYYASKVYYSPGNRIVTCEVYPCDVVSVPVDYDGQKLRCCEYYVDEDVTEKVIG